VKLTDGAGSGDRVCKGGRSPRNARACATHMRAYGNTSHLDSELQYDGVRVFSVFVYTSCLESRLCCVLIESGQPLMQISWLGDRLICGQVTVTDMLVQIWWLLKTIP